MRRKEIAKRLGILAFAFTLAGPCAIPAVCAADTLQAAQAQEPDQTAAGEKADTSQEPEEETAGLKLTMKTYEKEYQTEEGRTYKKISFEYPQAAGSSQAAQTLNRFYKNLLAKWKKAAAEDLKDAEEIVNNLAEVDDVERYYSDEVTCSITSQDENYISVLQSGYDYQMGAHGMPYRYTYIFDAKTGKKVSAASILGISKSQLNKKVRTLYLNKYDKTQKDGDYMFYPNRTDVKKTLDELNFNNNFSYLKNGKLRFYTDPYVVGPYAAGYIEVAVKL